MNEEIINNDESFYIHRDEVKRLLEEARKNGIEIGLKKAKKDYIDFIFLLPEFSEREETEYMRDIVRKILTFARNVLLNKVFMMTEQQIEKEDKKYFNKISLEKCCECFKTKENICKRVCPIDCQEYKKPCGFKE